MAIYDEAKAILKRADPSAIFRSQPITDWQGVFPLPASVAEYFTELGPVDITIRAYGNPYFFPSLARLWSHQIGYRIHGISGKRIEDWDDDWLVIADEGGDPFIFSRAKGIVLHAFHGEGVWNPKPIFENLPEMAITLGTIGDIVASAGESLTDDDAMILENYRLEVRRRIAELANSVDRADDILSSLGWT